MRPFFFILYLVGELRVDMSKTENAENKKCVLPYTAAIIAEPVSAPCVMKRQGVGCHNYKTISEDEWRHPTAYTYMDWYISSGGCDWNNDSS